MIGGSFRRDRFGPFDPSRCQMHQPRRRSGVTFATLASAKILALPRRTPASCDNESWAFLGQGLCDTRHAAAGQQKIL